MANLFKRLVALIPTDALMTGVVVSTDGYTSVLATLSGGSLTVRGTATVGATVYHRGGVIESEVQTMTGVDIEV